MATVTTGSTSGVAQIQQNGAASNSVPFTINTAAIISVSPNNGLAGTQVTISGSGFGAMQGSGNVWLGTVPAIVNSWSDGQVIATVAAGAATGNAMILQNGVMSNAVPFTINLPQITGITPNTGSAGTVVTITGVSFGATQGNGNVWIGSTFGSVIGWSNTQVTASVSASAVSGIVKIEQNGVWSNATTFTVPTSLGGGGGSSSVTLVPNVISLAVGGTQSIQALNSSGQSVTGLDLDLQQRRCRHAIYRRSAHHQRRRRRQHNHYRGKRLCRCYGYRRIDSPDRNCSLVEPRRWLRCLWYFACRSQFDRRGGCIRISGRR